MRKLNVEQTASPAAGAGPSRGDASPRWAFRRVAALLMVLSASVMAADAAGDRFGPPGENAPHFSVRIKSIPEVTTGDDVAVEAEVTAANGARVESAEARIVTAAGRVLSFPLKVEAAGARLIGAWPRCDEPGEHMLLVVVQGRLRDGGAAEARARATIRAAKGARMRLWGVQGALDGGVLYGGEQRTVTLQVEALSGLTGDVKVVAEPPTSADGGRMPVSAVTCSMQEFAASAGAKRPLSVTLSAPESQAPGSYQGRLRFVSATDEVSLPIRVEVRRPLVSVQPAHLKLGRIQRGGTASAAFRVAVEPRGGQTIRVEMPALSDDASGKRGPTQVRRVSAGEPAVMTFVVPVGDGVPYGAYRTYVHIGAPCGEWVVPVEFSVVPAPLTPEEFWARVLLALLSALALAALLARLVGHRFGLPRMAPYYLASAGVHVLALFLLNLLILEPVRARPRQTIPIRMVRLAGPPGLAPVRGEHDLKPIATPEGAATTGAVARAREEAKLPGREAARASTREEAQKADLSRPLTAQAPRMEAAPGGPRREVSRPEDVGTTEREIRQKKEQREIRERAQEKTDLARAEAPSPKEATRPSARLREPSLDRRPEETSLAFLTAPRRGKLDLESDGSLRLAVSTELPAWRAPAPEREAPPLVAKSPPKYVDPGEAAAEARPTGLEPARASFVVSPEPRHPPVVGMAVAPPEAAAPLLAKRLEPAEVVALAAEPRRRVPDRPAPAATAETAVAPPRFAPEPADAREEEKPTPQPVLVARARSSSSEQSREPEKPRLPVPETLTVPKGEPPGAERRGETGGPELQASGAPGVPAGGGKAAEGRIVLTTAKYAGDWDCDRTAMPNLAYQIGRRTRHVLAADYNELALTDPRVFQSAFVFMSGHKDFRFSQAEIVGLRGYLQAGGRLWVNDSTHEGDETFDRAFRREVSRLLAGARLERVPDDHPLFQSCYDLTHGYLGYRVPPGDKYRVDYLEGILLEGRLAVLYTRNDYGDGLEINEATFPLMRSLTDLNPQEMQEGSVRMGMNVAFHFLTSEAEKPKAARLRTAVEEHHESRRRETELIRTAQARPLGDVAPGAEWQAADWGDAFDLSRTKAAVVMAVRPGPKGKTVVGRDVEGDLSGSRYCVVELDSRMSAGARVTIGFSTGDAWRYFESAPEYVKPGLNSLIFDLHGKDFKTEASGWRQAVGLDGLDKVRRMYILIYPIRGGDIEVRGCRFVAAPPGDAGAP